MWVAFAVGVVLGAAGGVLLMGALAAGARQKLEESTGRTCATYRDQVRREMREAARWRDRALLCEARGPTVGDVDEIYKENVRLKAEIAVLREGRNRGAA